MQISRLFLGNWEAALVTAVLGWLTAGWLLLSRRSSKYVMLPAYFALMQTLQVLEFTVLDNCSSKLNQLLTLLSYIHVAFQPLVFNEFVWGQPQAAFNRPIITPYADSVMHKSIRRLSIAGAGLMLAKAAPAFLRFFGLGQRELGSTLGTAAAKMLTGPSTWCDRGPGESMCGRQLCTFKGKAHIGWVLPMIPHSSLVPSVFLHMFLMFGPALVLGGMPQRVSALVTLLTGPLAAARIIGNSERVQLYEWAPIWSYLSVFQVLLLLVVEVIVAKIVTGKGRLAPKDQRLGAVQYDGQKAEAETECTAVIHLYQQQLAGYKQQLGGYNKLH